MSNETKSDADIIIGLINATVISLLLWWAILFALNKWLELWP